MKICILYGGQSGEHEVSRRSAASVIKHLDPAKYQVTTIGIDKLGAWHLQQHIENINVPERGDLLSIETTKSVVKIVPSDGIHSLAGKLPIDCVFPVLHGKFGEDGTIQGLLELAGLPYVGAGVLSSAVSMDKEIAKRLWRDVGLPIVDFAVLRRWSSDESIRDAQVRLGWPLFVKPCGAGSSLGASRVDNEQEFGAALAQALQFDSRALLERYVNAREIECAVLGNTKPRAFLPGEVIPARGHGFYNFNAKYIDPNGAQLVATADLDKSTQEFIMRTAEAAYAAVRCEGMARVDFFMEKETGNFFLNEINTIPGFTSISMFPRMCQASGLSYPDLLTTLIELAMARSEEQKSLLIR